MVDFLRISTRSRKRGVIEIYPNFRIMKSSDLMIRGGDFYAIWLEDKGLWSTDEDDALQLIDRELDIFAEENKGKFSDEVKILHLRNAETRMIESWHRYLQKDMRDNFHMLDEKLIFSNSETNKKDYASKRLPYPLEDGDISAYDKLMTKLYSEEERHKIEWAIGSIVSGDSKKIQKFMVLYGAAGTGKSTVLNIIQQLFEGYYSVFDAKSLGSSNSTFALESFKNNPLVAIQHDGDLSRIEDNTRLNSLVSHEIMTVNEKFKSTYSNRFKCFLFMGTNKPVKITDAKSGLLRRLIDVSPTGDKLSPREYKSTVKQIGFELGAIAKHCLSVYEEDPGYYDNYIPVNMLGASNDFYNFVLDSYNVFKKQNGTTMKAAWEMYQQYCNDAKVPYPFSQRVFKEELKNYFEECKERYFLDDGTRARNYYYGFKTDIFDDDDLNEPTILKNLEWLIFKKQKSILDDFCKDCLAQYASSAEKPTKKWADVKTFLSSINTSRVHYLKPFEYLIVVDFDIPDENGEKSLERNLAEANKWPATYAELSKSGKGIHLHYIYKGDVSKLKPIYAEHIEIKTFLGGASLRRKLTKCNNIPIATISSGLPMKGEKVVSAETIKSEKSLRNLITRNLMKEIHPGTKPSIDFIFKILNDAYESGLKYDVSDMRPMIFSFAANSTHQAGYCTKLVGQMKFKSEDLIHEENNIDDSNKGKEIIFYDVEVFPNLFIVCWKYPGEDQSVVRMINPKPVEIEELIKFNLVGFNCRRYDNHILYARLLGYSEKALYELSKKIINGHKNAFFGEAYNISYTDVYDFSSKKQSLKKFEIELGIHHQELGLPWDEPVPESMWKKVAEYCDNDVIATEAVFNDRKADFVAREILADVAGMTVNDTTNSLTTKIIFGNDKHPQSQFNYRDLGKWIMSDQPDPEYMEMSTKINYNIIDAHDRPVFPGYKYKDGVSIYRNENVGEGGYVYAEPGVYSNVALLDIASMHPSSIIAEELFGPKYTARFNDILQARIAIKHKDFDSAKKMLGGKLEKYLTDESSAKALSGALKIAINSVYGLTAANFDNPFRDVRNVDNIVAKRGALFMVNLKHEVQEKGFKVAHIKTDSIKVPNATPEIINYIMEYGKMYGYNFEHEATYDRMCLVNDAVYIAKYARKETCQKLYNYIPGDNEEHPNEWTATGTQFQVPYVFKTLFSRQPLEFRDMCETKSVSKGDLYLDMNENLPDVAALEKELNKTTDMFKKGKISDTSYDKIKRELEPQIAKGHNYIFVGRVGQFCPIVPGGGGGILYRKSDDKYYAVTGTKGYRWLESEVVQGADKIRAIDQDYYISLVNDARKAINQHWDVEEFLTDDDFSPLPDFMNIPETAEEELPFN